MKNVTTFRHALMTVLFVLAYDVFSPCLLARQRPGKQAVTLPRVEGQTPIGTINGVPVTANDMIMTINSDSPFMPPLDGSPAPHFAAV